MTARWLFKEVSMSHKCINKAIILVPKNVWNNFRKIMFFLRDIIKIVSDQLSVVPTQPVIFM